MKTVAFFNNKGGVGKTTLIYHLAWMFSEMGFRVVAADYDPQANLTAISLSEQQIDELEDRAISSIYEVVAPLISEGKDVRPQLIEVKDAFRLIPGDLQLSAVEDALSAEWTKCLSDSALDRKRAFTVTTSLARAAIAGGEDDNADIILIDIGPNLGAINRSALLGADYVVVPVAPDIFSLQGLVNVGLGLGEWRKGWKRRLENAPKSDEGWPSGGMQPAGYVISRFSTYAGEKSAHFRRWIDRVPYSYHLDILEETSGFPASVENDADCLAWLKDYRSLMPMAHEVRKPIFLLKPGDGAIGAHQSAVKSAYGDFYDLASKIALHIGL
ncbi:UNVERIFIED_CONTAM: AAA family ATPase [Methylobacteriaceae bacterium AG10]|nr:AAA family ATPase [Methylobacteriaceae bacterium AG10]